MLRGSASGQCIHPRQRDARQPATTADCHIAILPGDRGDRDRQSRSPEGGVFPGFFVFGPYLPTAYANTRRLISPVSRSQGTADSQRHAGVSVETRQKAGPAWEFGTCTRTWTRTAGTGARWPVPRGPGLLYFHHSFTTSPRSTAPRFPHL